MHFPLGTAQSLRFIRHYDFKQISVHRGSYCHFFFPASCPRYKEKPGFIIPALLFQRVLRSVLSFFLVLFMPFSAQKQRNDIDQ